MQLFALDTVGKPILARRAPKKRDFFCPECNGILRVRAGDHRQPHFYHLSQTHDCLQNKKSMAHIQTQWRFFQLIPPGECILEKKFPLIQRIADVVWEPQKLIFEVQCSPISSQEMTERNEAYKSQGYQVIWILHEKTFNATRLSAAESLARKTGCYYTDIDANGNGTIFDQFDMVIKGIRVVKLKPLPVDIVKPEKLLTKESILQTIKDRNSNWKINFQGDLTHISHHSTHSEEWENYIAKAKLIEENYLEKFEKFRVKEKMALWIRNHLFFPYKHFLQMMVEKVSR